MNIWANVHNVRGHLGLAGVEGIFTRMHQGEAVKSHKESQSHMRGKVFRGGGPAWLNLAGIEASMHGPSHVKSYFGRKIGLDAGAPRIDERSCKCSLIAKGICQSNGLIGCCRLCLRWNRLTCRLAEFGGKRRYGARNEVGIKPRQGRGGNQTKSHGTG